MKTLLVHNDYQQAAGEHAAVQAQLDLFRQKNHPFTFYQRNNIEIDSYGVPEKIRFILDTIFSKTTQRDLSDTIKAYHPDIAHVHNVFPLISPAAYHVLHSARVPIVQTMHNFRFLCPNGLFYIRGEICERCKYGNTLHAVQRRCYRDSRVLSALYAFSIGLHRQLGTFAKIDKYLTLTEFTATLLVGSGLTDQEKIATLGNFLPDPLPEPNRSNRRDGYILFIGRLSREKGVDQLIRALKTLPKVHLKIAGDGVEADQLKALAQREGNGSIEFLGQVGGEQKWGLIRHAYATVVPSVWYENFPITILESMAVGTPVIAPRLGSFPYIIQSGRQGLLYQPGRVDDLGQKIKWLLEQPLEGNRMGQEGRQVIESKYSAGAHFEQLIRIYQETIGSYE